MNKADKIYVAGHRGMVGSALLRALESAGYTSLLFRTHAELDLTNQSAVYSFFEAEKPDYVFLAAAKVGGILANNTYPADFIRGNLLIQTNVIDAAYKAGVKRLLFLGSSCIYPKDCPQPIKEEYLLTGPLEPTNRPYALAKIAGVEQCWAYNRQYGTQFLAAMPTNLYGPGDNFDLQSSHVLPALIRKFHEAKISGSSTVTVWGSGKPKREFLYSDDLAKACLHLMNLPEDAYSKLLIDDAPPLINVGCGEDLSIADLAELVKGIVGFKGEIILESTKPDGTMRKLQDISKMKSLGWSPVVSLEAGISKVYSEYAKSSVV